MAPWLEDVRQLALDLAEGSLSLDLMQRVLVAVGVLIVGWFVARGFASAVSQVLRRQLTAQSVMVARLATYYGTLSLFAVVALSHVGIDLSVLVGAAGILTVAIGFAAQTSASNIISGLFLLGERPFVIGDVIEVSGHTGEVVGIDLMSVKLRTFANLLVRVPNETLLKSEIRNLTHFPLRRFDLKLRVPFHVDLGRARRLLAEVADSHPLVLDEPPPVVFFGEFGDNGTQLQFSVWGATANYVELMNSVPDLVREAFERDELAFAVPERVVHLQSRGSGPAVDAVGEDRAPHTSP